jgi:hypothetical protein
MPKKNCIMQRSGRIRRSPYVRVVAGDGLRSTTKCTCFPHSRGQRQRASCKVRDAAQKLSSLVRGSMSDQDKKKKSDKWLGKIGRFPKMCANYNANTSPAIPSPKATISVIPSRYIECCVVVLNVNHRACPDVRGPKCSNVALIGRQGCCARTRSTPSPSSTLDPVCLF